MHQFTSSSLAANLIDEFAGPDALRPGPAFVADALAYLNDSPDAHADDYRPGWQGDDYDPTPIDWSEYAEWSRSLDGGCGAEELSPDEREMITFSLGDREYREELQAMTEVMGPADWS